MKLTIPITPELRVQLLHAQNLEIEVPDTAVPEGWQLVPVEPTPEMLDAGAQAAAATGGFPEVWQEMLAAAQKLEGGAS